MVRRFKEEHKIEHKVDSFPETWTTSEISPQWGRLAIVTGGASGVGYESALALAAAGADVIIADVDEAQAHWAVGRIRSIAPAALVRFERVDLSDFRSIGGFVEKLLRLKTPVDLLINSAGIVATGRRHLNSAGIEMQFAVNYLGPFALSGMLFPLLAASSKPRVVQVSSISHKLGSIHFDDLQMERGYSGWKAQYQSRLAQVLFTRELARRSRGQGWPIMAVAAHPDFARKGIIANALSSMTLFNLLHKRLGPHYSHEAEQGALPILYAAVSPDVQAGGLYGPTGEGLGFSEVSGGPTTYPNEAESEMAQLLWERSEELTGVKWPRG